MRRYLPFVLVLTASAVVLIAAWVLKSKPKDEDAILGTWRLVGWDMDGVMRPPLRVWSNHSLKFSEKNSWSEEYGASKNGGTFKLDPEAKPKTMDKSSQDVTILALYELDGDTLKICFTMSGGARPTELKGDENTTARVYVYERVKEPKWRPFKMTLGP